MCGGAACTRRCIQERGRHGLYCGHRTDSRAPEDTFYTTRCRAQAQIDKAHTRTGCFLFRRCTISFPALGCSALFLLLHDTDTSPPFPPAACRCCLTFGLMVHFCTYSFPVAYYTFDRKSRPLNITNGCVSCVWSWELESSSYVNIVRNSGEVYSRQRRNRTLFLRTNPKNLGIRGKSAKATAYVTMRRLIFFHNKKCYLASCPVANAGIEPTTLALLAPRSNQLS